MSKVDPARGPDNDLMLGEFTDKKTLRFVRDFAHSAQTVWETLMDGHQYSLWLWNCEAFEARLGGTFRFDISGVIWEGRITEFQAPQLLELGRWLLFELFPKPDGCRMIFTVKRPPTGWSPMALAGYMGWLGRLSRLLGGTSQVETESWASSDMWQAMFPVYESLLGRCVSGGEKVVWRLHFGANDPTLTKEAIEQLNALAQLLERRPELNVVVDGFGDDPCVQAESLKLCQARIENAVAHLRKLGVAGERVLTGYVLGNYHYLVSRDTEAGRAFNRRIELRPTY